MKKVLIINGPNLNLLGKREPSIYGNKSFENLLNELKSLYTDIEITYFQSNSEGEIIHKIHTSDMQFSFILINPGGLTHTSVSLSDAIKSISTPTIEVHISNINARENFRKESITSSACDGMVAGLGFDSYKLALEHGLEKYD